MPYEIPKLRTKRQEGGGYGRRFGHRELSADETSMHETVSVYRVKVPIGNRYIEENGDTTDDYCPQDGPVEIKWTEWTWTQANSGGQS
jgi:hypothetical protein